MTKSNEDMNFFLAFLQGKPGHPIPAYNFWQSYIKNGLAESGDTWSECPGADWARGLVAQSVTELQKWKDEIWDKTIEYLKNNPADVFLSYLYPHQIDQSAVKMISSMGIPCVNFYCDHIRQFKKLPAEFECFDLNWVPEYDALKMYRDAGLEYIYLPMPAWVTSRQRMPGTDTIRQATFIGSKDIQRQNLFEQVFKQSPSLELHLYGAGWKAMHYNKPQNIRGNIFMNQVKFVKEYGLTPYIRKLAQRNLSPETKYIPQDRIHELIDDNAYTDLSRNSWITLGVNRYPSFRFPLNRPDSYSRLRDIEVPMMGACYLTEYTSGLEDLYDIGTEIMCYTSAEDLVEKCDMLFSDEKFRNALRVAGQKKALAEHAIPQSIKKIKDRL